MLYNAYHVTLANQIAQNESPDDALNFLMAKQ